MRSDSLQVRAIVVFLAVVYALAIALSLAVAATGGPKSPLVAAAPLVMLAPAVALLAVRLVTGVHSRGLGVKRLPVRFLPVALLLFPAVTHALLVPFIAWVEGGLPWQPWLRPDETGLFHAPDEIGWGTLDRSALVARFAVNAAIGLLIVSVLAFFEEIGWRAWLVPALATLADTRRAVVLTAAAWAFWHIPFALSGIHAFEHIPAPFVAAVMPAGHFGAGLVLGWLWVRSRSVWIVALAHGSLNNWGQFALKFMEAAPETDAQLLVALNITLLGLGLACLSRLQRTNTAGASLAGGHDG